LSGFFEGALQTSLTMEGLLFATFGFLYGAYYHYSSLPTPAHPLRPPIVQRLARACLFICIVVTLDACLALYIIIATILLTGAVGLLLGSGFILTIVVVVSISWYLVLSMF
jgi:hypothetical protein